jgi:hypothetical protein
VPRGHEHLLARPPETDLDPYLRPALPASDEQILDSILQFDVLTVLMTILGAEPEEGRSWYPNFAFSYTGRSEPVVRRFISDEAMRSALLPDGASDARVAAALRDIDSHARRPLAGPRPLADEDVQAPWADADAFRRTIEADELRGGRGPGGSGVDVDVRRSSALFEEFATAWLSTRRRPDGRRLTPATGMAQVPFVSHRLDSPPGLEPFSACTLRTDRRTCRRHVRPGGPWRCGAPIVTPHPREGTTAALPLARRS